MRVNIISIGVQTFIEERLGRQTVNNNNCSYCEEQETANSENLLQHLLFGQVEKDHNTANHASDDDPNPVRIRANGGIGRRICAGPFESLVVGQERHWNHRSQRRRNNVDAAPDCREHVYDNCNLVHVKSNFSKVQLAERRKLNCVVVWN